MGARAVIFIFFAASGCHGEWIRAASPGMEVVTDAGEKIGRRLLARFEQIREVFVTGRLLTGIGQAGRPWPVRAFVFATEKEFAAYRDLPHVQGFYTNGSERDYIVLHTGPSAERVAFHEYVHLVLNHSAIKLPVWFEEGMAEFYSTLEIGAGGVRVGLPIESHPQVLARVGWLTAPELAAVTAGSLFYTESDRVGIFYAQSWALVHMLNLSPAWREGLPRFLQLLGEERPPEAAFQEAFGRSLERALSELTVYLPLMKSAVVKTPTEKSSAPQVAPLTSFEAALERAELALHVHRPYVARTLLEKLPESRESRAGLGELALAEGQADLARREFDRAISLGSRDASMYFEYAMLERDSGAAPRRVRDLLESAIRNNPDFADAHFLLGVEDTDRGDLPVAIDHLREAVRVRPRRSDYWHALAYAEMKIGRREDMLRSARRALGTAENDAQTNSAEAMISMASDPAQDRPTPSKRDAVTTPSSWQSRKGDARVEGTLTRVDCEPSFARLYVNDGNMTVAVEVHHSDEVELVNSPQPNYQFSCGSQRLRVAVEYRTADREVTRIEFRP